MTVNFDVWGAPETWVDGSAAEQKANIKFAESSRDTYRENYVSGSIPLNSIDLPCYWGIGKGSIFRQPHYLSPYQSDGETKVAIDDVLDESQTSFPMMFFTASSVPNQESRFSYRYSPRRTTSPPQAVPFNTKIVMNFSYKDILLEPIVLYKDNTFYSSNRSTTLYNYIENAVYETYPRITGIGYTSYAGDGTTNRSKIYFYPLSTFTIKEYNLHYGSNYFWCQYLSNFLMNGVEIGTAQTPTIGATHTLTTTDINNLIGDSVTALAYKYSVNESTRVPFYYFDTENELWQINKTVIRSGSEKWYTYPYIETTAENAETVRNYVLSQIAFLGLPFVYDPSKSARGQIGETGVYLPKFDNKGVTTGEYLDGAESLTLPNSQWTDGRESGYDPDAGEGGDGDTGNLNNFPINLNTYANPNSVYALDEHNFYNFVSDVNNLYLTDTDDTRMKLDFKGSNPNDYVIGVYGIPFLCSYIVPSGGDDPISIGPVTLPTAKGKKVDISASLIRDCGTVTIPAKGNFLDYEPYTQIELYIPMCGTIQLDCAQVVGRTLHVIVWYDVSTMACTGCVYRDAPNGETLIHTINGTIGASLPLTASRMGDYQNSVQTTKNALKQNEMRTALGVGSAVIGIAGAALAPETGGLSLALAGAAIGGIATAAGGAMTEKQLQYDLTHKQPALSQCSAADGMTAQLVSDLRPWIFIKRAKKLESYDATTYGKTVGFACCINSTVGAFSGFTVYSNADLSGIPATKTEIDMIRAKLNNGIYI